MWFLLRPKIITTRLNPLSARAFFDLFLLKNKKKFDFVTLFLTNGSTEIERYCTPFCRKCQAQKCQFFFITFFVSEVTAVRSDHGVMSCRCRWYVGYNYWQKNGISSKLQYCFCVYIFFLQ